MAEKLSSTGTIGAANESVALAVSGMGGVAIQIQGTFSGTITFEASVQGHDFASFRVTPSDSSTAVTTATAPGLWVGSTVGYLTVRARFSSYASGKAVVFLQAELPSPGGSSGGGGAGSDVNLIEVGGSPIALGQAAMAASLPVVIASNQTAIPITGSITASNPSVGPTGDPVPAEATLVGFQEPAGDLAGFELESFDYDSGAGTQAQTTIGLVIPASGGPVPVGPLNPLPIVGTGTAGSPGTAVVTVQGIGSGTAVPISAAALPLPSGAATAANQQTDALTDTQLRATPVPVSGTVTTGGLTDAELRATPVPVSGTVTANLGTIAGVATEATLAGVLTSTNFAAAFGTAGSPDTQVLSVQGVASMTPLLVTPAANSAVNVAQVGGTNTVSGGVAGTLAVGGNVATNVAIGTNPVNLGAQAVSAENAAVTATRMAQLVTDLVGKLIVLPYANPENFVSGAITSAMTGTTSTSLIAAPASGLRNYITQITVSNAHASVGTDVVIQDGNGGTTLYTIPAAAVYGGATLTFPTPLRQPTTATAIYCANVTTGASTKVSASGYKGA